MPEGILEGEDSPLARRNKPTFKCKVTEEQES